MRPRILEIEGLQSFKDIQRIDFDMLSETGIFGIFGPTGSGKSTVLDAITLALYGKVHRAVNGTQGIINSGREKVKVSFTFDILKGSSRKTYRVERTYGRKKGTDNSSETKVARLIEINGSLEIPIVDKHGEVSDRVEELLGLKHEDFTRAVVLPQNKFQEFLFLKSSDKSKMLERIFYLEEYGKQLTEKVSNKINILRSKLANTQGALSSLSDASDTMLKEAEANLKEADNKKIKIIKEFSSLEADFFEAKEVWSLVNELNSAIQKEMEHLLIIKEIEHKKLKLNTAIKAEGMVDTIEKYNETNKILLETDHNLNLTTNKFSEINKEFIEASTAYEQNVKSAEIEQPKLMEYKNKLNIAAELKSGLLSITDNLSILRLEFKDIKDKALAKESEIKMVTLEIKNSEESIATYSSDIEKLKVTADYRNKIQEGIRLEDELKACILSLKRDDSNYRELLKNVAELENKQNEFLNQMNLIQKNYEALSLEHADHLNKRPGLRSELHLNIGNNHKVKSIITLLISKNEELENSVTKQDGLKRNIEELNKSLLVLYKERDLCLEIQEIHNQKIENLKQQIEKNTAFKLAKNLKIGDMCPVCGSTQHPNLATEEFHEEIIELEKELSEAEIIGLENESNLRDTENKCISLKVRIKGSEEQLAEVINNFNNINSVHKELISKLPEALQLIPLMQIEKETDSIDKKNEELLKSIDAWEEKLEDYKNRIAKIKDEISNSKVLVNGINSEIQVNKNNLISMEEALQEATRIVHEKQKLMADFLKKHKLQSVLDEQKRINQNDLIIEDIAKKSEQKQDLLKSAKDKLENLLNERLKLNGKLTEIETDGKNLKLQIEEKNSKLKEIVGECDIQSELQIVDDKINIIALKEKELSRIVKKMEEERNNLIMQKNTLENQKDIYSKTLISEKSDLEKVMKEKGFETIEDIQQAIIPKDQQKILNDELELYDNKTFNLKALRKIAEKKLQNRTITEEEWKAKESKYLGKIAERDDCLSRFEVLKNVYNTTKIKNEKWTVLNKDYTELSKKSDMLDQIKSLLKGNSFIEFIAEERLRYIAKEASETLGIMTKYRYVLELDSESNFVIRDNANGGVLRLVTSLSGGETFLTSLSLALALSKQIQLKGQSPLEFFFLDEGFGTLDYDLLDTVIDSLERLSTSERVIGLISHVPELKNRIARRLVINPPTADGKGSTVTIERA